MGERPLYIGDDWKRLVAPLVVKLQLAALLEMNTTFNTEGSIALMGVLQNMAERLDIAVAVTRAMEEEE